MNLESWIMWVSGMRGTILGYFLAAVVALLVFVSVDIGLEWKRHGFKRRDDG